MALSIDFHESRAPDGMHRQEIISAIFQDELYQGKGATDSFEGWAGSIVLAGKANPRRIFLSGTYNLKATSMLEISGVVTLDPRSTSPEYQRFEASLPCVDLSH